MLKNNKFYQGLSVLSILVFAFAIYDYYDYQKGRTQNAVELGISKNHEVSIVIDSSINVLESIAYELAAAVAENDYSKEELVDLVIDASHKSDLGLGITVAFEPFMFDSAINLFSPFYDRRQDKVIDIADVYDYTAKGLATTDWYTAVLDEGKAKWTKPYFAKGAQQLVSDFGVPIYKTFPNGNKELIGMVSYSIALERISKYVNQISLGASGYGYLANRDLELITHPNLMYLMNPEAVKKVVERIPEFKRFRTESEGYFSITSSTTGLESDLFFSTLDNGWMLAVVFNSKDLLGPGHELDNKIIHIGFAFSLAVFFSLIIFLKVYERETRKLWYFSILISFLTLANIILIWYININLKNSREDINNTRIVTETSLNGYLNTRNEQLKLIGYPKSVEIPTGIYISDVDFVNAYDVAIGGKIWQKISDTLEITHDLNFVFPQKSSKGLSVRTALVSKTHVNDYWLYRYNFTATLQFDFNYNQYPLDFRLLNIELMYPDIHENRILVPDLKGYKQMTPGDKPGISSDIYIPEANISSAYFSFSNRNFNSNLGNTSYNGPSDAPVLMYNIFVKRKIINPVISNILPIFIIAILIFLLSFTIHKVGGELLDGSALSVIQASGGFFFVLLLAHIQLRRNLLTPDLSYLETFYFVMYGAIALVSTGILLYVKTDDFDFLEYKHNIIVKLTFWPFLLFTVYLITLFMFY